MRILHVVPYLFPAMSFGGPAKVVYDLAQEQSKKNDVTIFTSDAWDEFSRIEPQNKSNLITHFKIRYFRNVINSWSYKYRFFSCFGMVF